LLVATRKATDLQRKSSGCKVSDHDVVYWTSITIFLTDPSTNKTTPQTSGTAVKRPAVPQQQQQQLQQKRFRPQ
jgi:hypothetical protein